ncbi:MAG: hypothetical protein F6J98_13925 [Moorea sp. SIO4G2]|nr:hypothetical protein [Moorena sp. SIO4G2]
MRIKLEVPSCLIAILFPMRYKAMQRGLGGSPHERLHQEGIPLNPP